MWRKHDLARLRGRSATERDLLVEAMWWLGVARGAILALPFRWTARLFALSPGETQTVVNPDSPEVTQRIAWALRVASARSPWRSTCLAQALAGSVMLRRRRLPGTLVLGVARSDAEGRQLMAHAWLSSGRAIITGIDEHERYNAVAKFTVNRRCVPPRAS